MARGGFFAVGRQTFASACNLGVNAGAAFLVLARGSGGDNVTTSWSAQAGSKYLGIRWKTAHAAIMQLERAKIIKRDKASSTMRPRYTLAKKGDLIWLPNSLVDGVAGEIPPITKMRQTQDALALRLLVDLYGKHNLREDGGVSPQLVWQAYERTRVGQRGAIVVWRFHDPTTTARPNDLTTGWYTDRLEVKRAAKSGYEDFWPRLGLLEQLGLIEWVPYLFEGPEGEPIHPLHANSAFDIEADLFAACHEAAMRCLTEGQYDFASSEGGVLVPVPAHIEQVQIISIARLRYRPHTSLTFAWWAQQNAHCKGYTQAYAGIAVPANTVLSAQDVA